MTDRERLIELIKQKSCVYNECEKSCSMCDCIEIYDSSIETISDYLLENGVIVPPCKVGDTVYLIYGLTDIQNIIKCTVNALHITSGRNRLGHRKPSHVLLENEVMPRLTSKVYLEEFGKTIFLTRDEAEKALKEHTHGT